MKKTTIMILAVFMLGIAANAQETGEVKKEMPAKHEMRKGPDGEKRAAMMEHFKARKEEEKALYEKYAAATTDAEKKTAESEIKAYVEKDSKKMMGMFQKRIDESEKTLKEAKKRYAEVKKNDKNMQKERVERIKEGKLGPKGGMKDGKKCEDGKCPFGPRGEMKGKKGPRPHGPRPGMEMPEQAK